jgi:signal transduction histidine kinase
MPPFPTRPARALLVNADAGYIAQVVTNYLSNALKYSKADQPMEVRVKRGG